MSSFRYVAVASIHSNDSSRQRKNLGDVGDLAKSIAAVGLINPLVTTRDGELIAGRRRLEAVRSLGWTHVPVQFRDELSDLERERIEFDENAHRLDLTWQERTLAIHRFHELSKQIEGPDWTQEQTADRLGSTDRMVRFHLRVAQALLAGDKMVVEAPQFSTALGIVQRYDSRKASSSLEKLDAAIKTNGVLPNLEILRPRDEARDEANEELSLAPILQANFIEWAAEYKGPKFNLIHCDFPYGIDAGGHDQGAGKAFGTYEDEAEVYWNLISALGHYGENFIADSAHMIFWYSPKFHSATMEELSSWGWSVNPYPLIWHRSDNSGIIPDPRRMPRQVYETAFLCSRGDRQLVRAKSNLIASPNVKKWHMSEKPRPVLDHFLSMLVDDTSLVLDPTCGSGNAIISAYAFGAKLVLGIERDEEFYRNAQRNWKESQDDA